MRTVAIICEYNPFHFGHAEQIAYIRAKYDPCTVLCIMSGNFVQRGECAVYDKYLRARSAVQLGGDLVVELPYPFCASGAETFAEAGVQIAAALHADLLCFGSECGDITALRTCAERMESEAFREAMKVGGEGSESYAARSQRIYESLYGEGFPVTPNDILAVCYLRAMLAPGREQMTADTYKRTSPYSATASRGAIRTGDTEAQARLIPQAALACYAGATPTAPIPPLSILQTRFTMCPEPEKALCAYDGMSPGIPSRMKAAVLNAQSAEDLVAALTSKRDTAAKIRRSLLACLTETTREMPHAAVGYTMLLATSERGRAWLSENRRTHPELPILTRPSRGSSLDREAAEQFAHALRADMLYAICRGERPSDALRKGPAVL